MRYAQTAICVELLSGQCLLVFDQKGKATPEIKKKERQHYVGRNEKHL